MYAATFRLIKMPLLSPPRNKKKMRNDGNKRPVLNYYNEFFLDVRFGLMSALYKYCNYVNESLFYIANKAYLCDHL